MAGSIIGAVAAPVIGSIIGSDSADDATASQQQGIANATKATQDSSRDAYNILKPVVDTGVKAGQIFAPTLDAYTQAGKTGLAQLGAQTGTLDVSQFLDPSMAFAQEQSRKALEGSAAARGGLLSGATAKSIADYSTKLASQNYQQAVDNAFKNRQQQLGIAGTNLGLGGTALDTGLHFYDQGIGAIGNQANIISNQGQTNANLAMTSGNVNARNDVAQGNFLGNAVGGVLGALISDENAKISLDTKKTIQPVTSKPVEQTMITSATAPANTFTDLMGNWGSSQLDGATPDQIAKLQAGDKSGYKDKSSLGVTRTIYYQGKPINIPIAGEFTAPPASTTPTSTTPKSPNPFYGFSRGDAMYTMDSMDPGMYPGFMMMYSDEESKEALKNITDDEIDEFLSNLQGKEYKYNDKAKAAGASDGEQNGVIAQDMEKSKIGKRLVKQDPKTGYKTIDIPQSVGTLFATASSLNDRVNKLEKGKK